MKKLIVPIVLCWILLAFLAGAVIALTEEITRLETELQRRGAERPPFLSLIPAHKHTVIKLICFREFVHVLLIKSA